MGAVRNLIDWALCRKAVEQAGMEITRKAAEYMAARAAMLAPVDTGLLKSSVQVVKASGGGHYHVIATAPYAQFVEFGHLAGGRTWVPPNPFMRNAMADTVRAFPQIARSVKLRRPDGSGNEWEPSTFSATAHLGVSFDA